MFNNLKVQEIEKIIGYEFKDKSLLVRAFTHPSLKPDVTENYQTIEFLGDSILDFIVAEKLMELHPTLNEGFLTKMRAQVVSEQPLADAIGRIRIAEFMQFGMGERRHKIYENDSIKCDLFESIVGAIYLDGGMVEAKRFVLTMLDEAIKFATAEEEVDAKSRLNEYASKHSPGLLSAWLCARSVAALTQYSGSHNVFLRFHEFVYSDTADISSHFGFQEYGHCG